MLFVNIINMSLRKELLKNIKNFMTSADLLYKNKDYTSSCILYFKTLFSILDYLLLLSGKGIPKDHKERFDKLKSSFKKLYVDLEKLYPLYRTTYRLSVNKIKCGEVRDYAKKLVKEFKIS